MGDFTSRLQACAKRSEMTVSDLARWFDRPRATVDTWLKGRVPFGPQAKPAEKKLSMLEFSIRTRSDHYPIPEQLSWKLRAQYVRGMWNDAERRYSVPAVRAAG